MKPALSLSIMASLWLVGFVVQAAETSGIFTPKNPPEMQPLAHQPTPAFQAAAHFQHGVNLGNYLETPAGRSWGVTVSGDEFIAMKRAGFDHVRVPIGWHHYAGPTPEFSLAPGIFSRVDFVITNALASGLAVLINIHHFNELDQNPVAAAEEFVKIWQQIAAYYRTSPADLAFELDNEPHENATTALMNPLYARAIAEIRQSNPQRTIFVEPGNWGGIDELNHLVLPPDENLIVSVHCYAPFYFTHQGATWTKGETPQTGIVFPGPPAQPLVADPKLNSKKHYQHWIEQYNTLAAENNPSGPKAFTEQLKFLHDWSAYYGRPVHIGEFGAYTKADATSRAKYYEAFRRTAEAQQLGWCIWDWSAGFRYWDKNLNQPMPGLPEALFGKSK